MKKYDIVIIDTGVRISHPCLNEHIEGIGICDGIITNNDISDDVGHGTAIFTIINRETNNANIYVIKIVDDLAAEQDELSLIMALEYVYNNIECSLINISLGINLPSSNSRLLDICVRLNSKGIILVAAYDNFGAVTYPAYYDCVIGVTSDEYCRKKDEFTFYDDLNVNIAGNGNVQRVAWLEPDYIYMNGNSLACAHITSFIYNSISNHKCERNLNSILMYLKINAKYIITQKNEYTPLQKPKIEKIKKCILFPFNKEMQALIRFQDLLSFSISGVYDVKYSGRIGCSVNYLLRLCSEIDFTIKNLANINWDEFDTLIIGHIKDLLNIGNCYETVNNLILEAVKHNKYIYSFGEISDLFPILINSHANYYVPSLKSTNIKQLPDGKLFCSQKPILGVFGTSSKQGKYTLQLALRRELLSRGYKVGQIGTEASAYLFGMDECFPFGHESTVSFERFDVISYLNKTIEDISNTDVDIIISGCQAGTLTDNECSLYRYALPQYEFLLGLNPDAVILCINQYNDEEEIRRHIHFLEASVNCKVLALVLFPITLKNENTWYQNKFETIPLSEIEVI